MQCPNCGKEDIIPITYGTPPLTGARLKQAIERQEIVLGGCYLCGDAPGYVCRSCQHRFDPPKPERKRRFFDKK